MCWIEVPLYIVEGILLSKSDVIKVQKGWWSKSFQEQMPNPFSLRLMNPSYP